MSQPTDPNQTPPEYAYAQPLEYSTSGPVMPTSILVISIIGIVFGGLGVLCTPLSILGIMIPQPAAQVQDNPMLAVMETSPLLKGWTIVSSVLAVVLSIVLMTGSIASLVLKRWARKLMLGYAWTQVAMTVLGFVAMLALLVPALMEFHRNQAGNSTVAMIGTGGGLIGTVLGLVFGIVLPVCILIFYRQPHVVAAFEGSQTY